MGRGFQPVVCSFLFISHLCPVFYSPLVSKAGCLSTIDCKRRFRSVKMRTRADRTEHKNITYLSNVLTTACAKCRFGFEGTYPILHRLALERPVHASSNDRPISYLSPHRAHSPHKPTMSQQTYPYMVTRQPHKSILNRPMTMRKARCNSFRNNNFADYYSRRTIAFIPCSSPASLSEAPICVS